MPSISSIDVISVANLEFLMDCLDRIQSEAKIRAGCFHDRVTDRIAQTIVARAAGKQINVCFTECLRDAAGLRLACDD